jgi:hypothetical protein
VIEKEKEIAQFFQTDISPVFEEETLEISAFMQENGFCDVYDLFQSDPDIHYAYYGQRSQFCGSGY